MKEFTCAVCGYLYTTNTSEEEKESEFFARYGHAIKDSDEDVYSLCDECNAIIVKEL